MGEFAKPGCVVATGQGLHSLLSDADLSYLFDVSEGLRIADPNIDLESLPPDVQKCLKQVGFSQVARNDRLLRQKATLAKHTEWFQSLYSAMAKTAPSTLYMKTQQRGRHGHLQYVDDPILVLTENSEVLPANKVYLRKIPQEVLDLRSRFNEVDDLLNSYKLIHPCLDTEELGVFFKERTHVQEIDYDKICREVFLPRIRTSAPKPPTGELIACTRLVQKGPLVNGPIWVSTKRGDLKPSNEAFMGIAYSPAENWEKNEKFMPQIDFLSSEYLTGVAPDEVTSWKEFFLRAGVKDTGGPNHVESFGMTFTEHILADSLIDFVPKDKQRVGYDREARRKSNNELIKLEIKGQKREGPVELAGNEAHAAKRAQDNNEPFWVCIVPGIPENPQLWVLENACGAGEYSTLTIDITSWKVKARRWSRSDSA